MVAGTHSIADVRQQFDVSLFRGAEWVLPEVRQYRRSEKRAVAHFPLERLIRAVGPNRAAPEVPLDLPENLRTVAVLAHRHAWTHFPS